MRSFLLNVPFLGSLYLGRTPGTPTWAASREAGEFVAYAGHWQAIFTPRGWTAAKA